jgi:hypothetical protein
MRLVRSTWFCLLGTTVALTAAAQTAPPVPLASPAPAYAAPGGNVIATIFSGTKVAVGASRGSDTRVTFEGWVDTKRLGAGKDSFAVTVEGPLGLRLRAGSSVKADIIGELRPGIGLNVIKKSGSWSHVRRSVWVPTASLGAEGKKQAAEAKPASATAKASAPVVPEKKAAAEKAAPVPDKRSAAPDKKGGPAAQPTAPPVAPTVAPPVAEPAPAEPTPTPIPDGALAAARGTRLLTAPGSTGVGTLATGAIVEPLVRDRGWVKVKVEGWVNERDLVPADSAYMGGITVADLRADPAKMRGKILHWEVQILSLQTADGLRPDLGRDEPYLLARGPAGDNSLLYLAVPPSLLAQARGIAPLTSMIITARVRNGKSEPVGTPILDLTAMTKK